MCYVVCDYRLTFLEIHSKLLIIKEKPYLWPFCFVYQASE